MTIAAEQTDDTRPRGSRPAHDGAAGTGRHRSRFTADNCAHHRIAAVVCAVYFVASFVVFRDVALAIPDILSGKRVLVGDELVKAADHVAGHWLHRSGSVQQEPDLDPFLLGVR